MAVADSRASTRSPAGLPSAAGSVDERLPRARLTGVIRAAEGGVWFDSFEMAGSDGDLQQALLRDIGVVLDGGAGASVLAALAGPAGEPTPGGAVWLRVLVPSGTELEKNQLAVELTASLIRLDADSRHKVPGTRGEEQGPRPLVSVRLCTAEECETLLRNSGETGAGMGAGVEGQHDGRAGRGKPDGDPETLVSLARVIGTGPTAERVAAAEALSRLPLSADEVPLLLQLIEGQAGAVQAHVIRAIGNALRYGTTGPSPGDRLGRDEVPSEDDKDHGRAARERGEPDWHALLAGVRHAPPELREFALNELAFGDRRPPPQFARPLEEALDDPSPRMVALALAALSRLAESDRNLRLDRPGRVDGLVGHPDARVRCGAECLRLLLDRDPPAGNGGEVPGEAVLPARGGPPARPDPAVPPADRLARVWRVFGDLKARLVGRREESAADLRGTLETIHEQVLEGEDAEANRRLMEEMAALADLAGCRLVVDGKQITFRIHRGTLEARTADKSQTHVASGRGVFPISAEAILPPVPRKGTKK